MRMLLVAVLFLMTFGTAQAIDISVGATSEPIPSTAVPRLTLVCEDLRESTIQNPATWNHSKCALDLIRIGSKEFTADQVEDQVRADGKVTIANAMAAHDDDFPLPIPSVCGDGVVDTFDDLDEECDDGNTECCDGCQPDCALPICGDGFLDPGEECDDGNTDDGDGCDATCQNE